MQGVENQKPPLGMKAGWASHPLTPRALPRPGPLAVRTVERGKRAASGSHHCTQTANSRRVRSQVSMAANRDHPVLTWRPGPVGPNGVVVGRIGAPPKDTFTQDLWMWTYLVKRAIADIVKWRTLRYDHPRLPRQALNPMTNVLTGDRRERRQRTGPCENGGFTWSHSHSRICKYGM